MKIKYLALSFAFVAAGLSSANADRLVIKARRAIRNTTKLSF
jgi:hypothetical protein